MCSLALVVFMSCCVGGGDGGDAQKTAAENLKREEEAKRENRLREEPTVKSDAEEQAKHKDKLRTKLRESALSGSDDMMEKMQRSGGPPGITYDGLCRPAQRVMPLDPQSGVDFHDHVVLSSQRMMQNVQVGSKWTIGKEEHSSWEFTLGMHGFSDNSHVSYTTGGKWTLVHQRMFRNGAFGMLQLMLNPQMGPMGNIYVAMLNYPWAAHGGTTTLQYVRHQQAQLSHAARIVRGLDVGAALTYDMMTNSTNVTYAFQSQSSDKARTWCGSWTPITGAWKLALTKFDWASDLECGAQLELADKRGQLLPSFSVGIRKLLFGGGTVHGILTNFHKLRALVELPFGGERAGFNQVKMTWLVQYDSKTGASKHGVSLNF